MKAYKKIMGGIAEFEKIVLSVILVFVTVITFANVVVRKLTTSQLAFTEELVINLFVLMIMLGCALSAREGSLISLSLIFDRLKDRQHRYFACPKCRQTVRVPRGKGKISITCPKCREKFIRKT